MPRTKRTEADLAAVNEGERPMRYADGSLGVNTPFDMNAYVRVWRLQEEQPDHDPTGERGNATDSQALTGHLLEVDLYQFGVKVRVRMNRGDNKELIISVEDDDGVEEVGTWGF